MLNSPYPTGSAIWRIELFGSLTAHGIQRTVTRFRSAKVGALLGFLALHLDRSHPRETLADLFWPEAKDSRLALRVALNSLRRQLEPLPVDAGSILVSDGACVRLNRDAVTTDVAEFCSAMGSLTGAASMAEEQHILRRAVGMCTGDLLAGYYEDWILTERDRLTHLNLQALKRLSELLRDSGELNGAIDFAHRAISLDFLNEANHVCLIQIYLDAGCPADAVRRYRELERLLRLHLGSNPSSRTRDLVSPWLSKFRDCAKPVKRRAGSTSADLGPPMLEPPARRLPLTLTRFFGRELEIATLRRILDPCPETDVSGGPTSRHRLVTLVGGGGTGKTRLAIETARRLTADFGNRIWFVPLADVSEAGLIPEAILKAMNIAGIPGSNTLDQAAAALDSCKSILILDNFEHLLDSGREIVWRLLDLSRDLTCLVTSRIPLGVEGERRIEVTPLPVTVGTETALPDERDMLPSVRLFVDRAQAALPDFAITKRNYLAIAQLTARLEGIPLAIELVAALAQTLSPAEMLNRLDDRFALTISRRYSTLPRHRSLRATLEWSYNLLDGRLRRFLNCLSVFRGGWTAEAAQSISNEPDALDCLRELCDRSLIAATAHGEVTRYSILDTVREFAQITLPEADREPLLRRHAAHYLAVMEYAASKMRGPGQAKALETMELEYANALAVLEGRVDSEVGLRLAVALACYLQRRGRCTEASLWVNRSLSTASHGPLWNAKAAATLAEIWCVFHDWTKVTDNWTQAMQSNLTDRAETIELVEQLANPIFLSVFRGPYAAIVATLGARQIDCDRGPIAAFVLACQGKLAHFGGDYDAADDLHSRAQSIYTQRQDSEGVAIVLANRGETALRKGDYDAASRFWEESLEAYRTAGDQVGVAQTVSRLGYIAYRQADFPRAIRIGKEALTLNRNMGHRSGVSTDLWILANVSMRQGDYEHARRLFAESLELRRELADTIGIADALSSMAVLLQYLGEFADSYRLQCEALDIRRKLTDKLDIGMALVRLGNAQMRLGHDLDAENSFDECLATCREVNANSGVAHALLAKGLHACRQGHPQIAKPILRQSAELFCALKNTLDATECAEAAAEMFANSGAPDAATRLYAASERNREILGAPLPPSDLTVIVPILKDLSGSIGHPQYEEIWSMGRSTPIFEALAREIKREEWLG